MAISLKTSKNLWAKSGNKCAICGIELFTDLGNIGEECHLISSQPTGPRHNSSLENYDLFSNLILLCRNHHKEIDEQTDIYSLEKLRDIKSNHENRVQLTLKNLINVHNLIEKKEEQNQQNLSFSYFLDSKKQNQLYLKIQSSNELEVLNLKYKPKTKNWNKNECELNWEDTFYWTLLDFEKYIQISHLDLLSKDMVKPLKNIIDKLNQIIYRGIEKIAEFLFDYNNRNFELPKYQEFIQAFELYSVLKKEKYEAQIFGNMIFFKTRKKIYQMDTCEGKTTRLKKIIDNRAYDEIYIDTDENIWNEIYFDPGIPKSEFVPVILNEWELYWDKLYEEIEKQTNDTKHLHQAKEKSFRQLKIFNDTYNDTLNVIKLAYDFDKMLIFPLAVLTMLKIYNAESCYEEYCDFEFWDSGCWENICFEKDNEEPLHFFIRQFEASSFYKKEQVKEIF